MTTELTHTRLETILDREFELQKKVIRLVGTTSPLTLAFFFSQTFSKHINDLPHVVVFPDEKSCRIFQQCLEVFNPKKNSWILPGFDVSPFSGLYPNSKVINERLNFLYRAQNSKPGDLFLVTAESLSQRTLPYSVFSQKVSRFSVGDSIPENFSAQLQALGYSSAPMVEDVGQFAIRGGIIDIFSAAHAAPVRIELFGDQIESLRHFNISEQRSTDEIAEFHVIPAREVMFTDDNYETMIARVRGHLSDRKVSKEDSEELIRALVLKNFYPGIEFLLPYFYSKLDSALDYFSSPVRIWSNDPPEISRKHDEVWADLKKDYENSESILIRPELELLYTPYESLKWPEDSFEISISNLEFLEEQTDAISTVHYRTQSLNDFQNLANSTTIGTDAWIVSIKSRLEKWRADNYRIIIAVKNPLLQNRLKLSLEKMGLKSAQPAVHELLWDTWLQEQDRDQKLIHILPQNIFESQRIDEERLIFLRESDFFGAKERRKTVDASEDFQKKARRLSFGDLKPGDFIVHVKHGIGQYEGLRIMNINGADSEFIQLSYKDKDKLYLPVYRIGQIQKYSGPSSAAPLDRLGGQAWEKTKIKVKGHLRDMAADLLQLYAKRAEILRPAFKMNEAEVAQFERSFPYEETDDQLRALSDITKDFLSPRPMDRLICGDVGFGKTEVAMRAAFFTVQNQKQVAVLAPTTVLTFQHLETFRKRFHGWPIRIEAINRFVSPKDAKKILAEAAEGKVDILIGTHRILSKDVTFKDLGLLIVDEEQKFGVAHKERVKKMKTQIDTLTLSATPIPRTLNMSLVGIRDLSLINTAPVDRLPTRTFICKFEAEILKKAIEAEIARGGQIYFVHNRVQSIYGVADEIRQLVPKARIKVAHGQMPEHELETTMLGFFHHEVDLLICTAIVESGMDVPTANTIFIDQAHMFGVSQLYQLRGRVGRAKQRAYCYLVLPRDKKIDSHAQVRLKIIQENTALGSGLKIAQYDLELRGSGNILGESQSGHIDSVGYELYMDLLAQALAEAKGQPIDDFELDPEVNLRIPALIPDSYIPDIRLRLSYYKALADIKSEDDLNQIEAELRDQYGEIPESTVNLMGLMLIRKQCKDLGVRDISAGVKSISLIFTEKTRLKTETIISLATRENKKYSITPDHRLNVRLNTITWSAVFEELNYLLKLQPKT